MNYLENAIPANYLISATAALICYILQSQNRSSRSQMFFKKRVIKFSQNSKKNSWYTPAQICSCWSCEILSRTPIWKGTSRRLLLSISFLKYLKDIKCKTNNPCLEFWRKQISKPSFSFTIFPWKCSSEPKLVKFDSTVRKQVIWLENKDI